jgi:hypothetical protein
MSLELRKREDELRMQVEQGARNEYVGEPWRVGNYMIVENT